MWTRIDNFVTPLKRVLLEKATASLELKKSPAFYRTWKSITLFTVSCKWSLLPSRCVNSSISEHNSLKWLLLSAYFCLYFLHGFKTTFPTHAFSFIYSCYIPRPFNAPHCPNHVTRSSNYKASLTSCLQPPDTSSLTSPNVLLSTIFWRGSTLRAERLEVVYYPFSKYQLLVDSGHTVAHLVEALRYKLEVRGFDSRCCHWDFSLT